MTPLVALAVSIGLLGGVATALYLKVGLAIWAAFLAWACFFHTGGDTEALKKTIIGNLFGIVCAAVAAGLILSTNLGAAGPPVIVGVTVFFMVLAAHLKPFATIPASVYGYAATFAFLLQTTDAMVRGKLVAVDRGNPILVVAVSMVLGALFGWASAKLAAALTKKAAAA
jgi:hypothetical protein